VAENSAFDQKPTFIFTTPHPKGRQSAKLIFHYRSNSTEKAITIGPQSRISVTFSGAEKLEIPTNFTGNPFQEERYTL